MQTSVVEDTHAYMEKFTALIREGETLSLPVLGNSMNPFLVHRRDTVWLARPDRPLKKGDIVLYLRRSGDYVLHRICGVKDECYTLIGDAQTRREEGIQREQIIAVVRRAQRKGRSQHPGCFWWEFFARVWVRLIPLRPALTRCYLLFRRKT